MRWRSLRDIRPVLTVRIRSPSRARNRTRKSSSGRSREGLTFDTQCTPSGRPGAPPPGQNLLDKVVLGSSQNRPRDAFLHLACVDFEMACDRSCSIVRIRTSASPRAPEDSSGSIRGVRKSTSGPPEAPESGPEPGNFPDAGTVAISSRRLIAGVRNRSSLQPGLPAADTSSDRGPPSAGRSIEERAGASWSRPDPDETRKAPTRRDDRTGAAAITGSQRVPDPGQPTRSRIPGPSPRHLLTSFPAHPSRALRNLPGPAPSR